MHGVELAAIDLADILAMARAAIITVVTDLYKFLPPPGKPSKDGGKESGCAGDARPTCRPSQASYFLILRCAGYCCHFLCPVNVSQRAASDIIAGPENQVLLCKNAFWSSMLTRSLA